MGIPKFFRYISERYPLTSQLIQENKIPEFDNLYLDFNSIIHNCSHPNDEDAHFRLSEEQIFTSIFAYVDHLFSKIKPRKLFFMAVDGVAPRAKMNQQRSRRFRTAKEAKEVRDKALSRGEKLPDEKAFDSNCITPGTPFMARLSEQLRYFVNKKITEDSTWRNIEVVLSGHEVPGEGEHKIMEYIRLSRAQPDYNPNVRHCLYGLDADLIMLGLLSHDPHFCLLREEVKFGPSSRKKGGGSLDSINFYLLHICLLREYLDLEFHDIVPVLPFDYNLERIIDDFVLLAVFVGNDFLPNLPDLHIHTNGLEKLFEVYKKVLPGLDGYINDSGRIHTGRLQAILNEMAHWELDVFQQEYADMNWYKGKQAKHVKEMEDAKKRTGLVLTRSQRFVLDLVKDFVWKDDAKAKLAIKNDLPASDRKFMTDLAGELHLDITWDEYEGDDSMVTLRLPEVDADDDQEGEWEDVDGESRAAVQRVLRKYDRAKVLDDEDEDFDTRHERSVKAKMDEWKDSYYKEKLEFSLHDTQHMNDLAYRYIEGLQWVMFYYYSGVASWGWFYNYHYAPRISDLKDVDNMTFNFELGTPFKPFEQLMSVLPAASKEHIPLAYQDLMYDPGSSILDFYPTEFEQDLNGKKQDWEAIVKIPFIDEKRLLKAMATREHRLNAEEKLRNTWGTSTKFAYNNGGEPTTYPSSLPGFFPPIIRCMCVMQPFDLPTLDGLHLVEGLCDGVFLGVEALAGFPSLKTLPHTASLGFHGVNVHGSESRNKSMVVHIENPHEGKKTEEIARTMIDQRIFTGWPFLQEAKVIAVSDSLFKYEKMAIVAGQAVKVISNPHSPHGLGHWKTKAERIENVYSKRCGVITGAVDILLHVRPLKGLKRLETGALVKDYEGADKELETAVQMSISEVVSEDPRFLERAAPPLHEEFPEGSKIFFLGEHAYGVAAQVSATTDKTLSVILAFFPSEKAENDKFKETVEQRKSARYLPSFRVAEMVGLSGRALSRITSSFMVLTSDNQKTNVGLSLKFEAKSLKVLDYSRKNGRHWEFSEKAITLIKEYKAAYPGIFAFLDKDGDAMVRASDIFSAAEADKAVRNIKAWLNTKGVRDFEPVSLFCDQLTKDTVSEIEKLADGFNTNKSATGIKKAIVKGIPRQAVLKPAHAVYRLQNQRFALGDRVTMVRDSGGVPLAAKGVVVGLNASSMEVVWDVPFMAGTTLSDRCSQYRGSTVEFNTCLNLSDPQFVASTNPKTPQPAPTHDVRPFKPRIGPHPAVASAAGQAPASGFRSAPTQTRPLVQIMANPNRGGRGSPWVNGRGAHNHVREEVPVQNAQARQPTAQMSPNGRGIQRAGRGFNPHFRGRGGIMPNLNSDRGRGGVPRGLRGRGRGSFAAPVQSS